MKYFTPDLYAQGQSRDDDVLDGVEQEWERRLKRYQRQYKKVETQLPVALRRFHDEQCLHDADWCGIAEMPIHPFATNSQGVTIVASQENTLIPEFINTLAILQYEATAPPAIEYPVESEVFSFVQPIWLYDEIDLVSPGVFSHSILVSNGMVVTIQFREFRYHVAPLLAPVHNPEMAKTQPAPRRKSASA